MIESIYKTVTAFLVVSCFIVLNRLHAWKRETEEMVKQVLHCNNQSGVHKASYHNNHALFVEQSMRSFPLAIQRYLHKALFLIDDNDRGIDYMMHTPLAMAKSLVLEQEGTILVNGQWLPFKAIQNISTSLAAPGFVWDCASTMQPPLPILKNINLSVYARDAYIDGQGKLDASVLGIVPMAHMKGNSDINSAALMRWLAEIVLYPTACLPHSGMKIHWVKGSHRMEGPWSQHHGAFTRARLVDDPYGETETETEVEFCFDEAGLVSVVRGHRAQNEGGRIVMSPWEAHVSHYEVKDGMFVPTEVEAGYWNDGKLQYYFKAKNTSFHYTFFES